MLSPCDAKIDSMQGDLTKTPPKNLAASLRNRYRRVTRRLAHEIDQTEMAAEERLAHKGIHSREQIQTVLKAIKMFKCAVPILFEQDDNALPPDFDFIKALENAVPIEVILEAGKKWNEENPRELGVLRAMHLASEMFGKDGAEDWINAGNVHLRGRSPAEVIAQDAGGMARVMELLNQIKGAIGGVLDDSCDADDTDQDVE